MSMLEIKGPLQAALRSITPYLKEKLCAHTLKDVDVCVIGRVNGEPPMVDLYGTIQIDELIAMLRALADHLESRKRQDKFHIGRDWT